MGPIEALLLLVVVGAFAFIGLSIWAIVDAAQRPPEQFPRWTQTGTSNKTTWIIGLVVGWVIGLGWVVAIVYLMVVRKKMGPIVRTEAPPPPAVPPA
jgi:hypothetical protein